MLLKTVGWLLMIESVFICVPTIVSLCYGEDDWSIFALTVAITFAVGFILNNCVHATYSRMARREGFLLTGFTWVIFSLFGMLPLIFASSSHLSITDAFLKAFHVLQPQVPAPILMQKALVMVYTFGER